jgi:hypothetical protein
MCALILKSSQCPHGRLTCCSCCLQGGGVYVSSGTVTITSSSITGNTASVDVRAYVQNFPSPRWETHNCLLFAGRRYLFLFRHGHDNVFLDLREYSLLCARSRSKLPIAPMGNSRFARCLQGGAGVAVFGDTVTISSCTISGNAADYVRAHPQKFPMPLWEISDALALTLAWQLWPKLRSTTVCTCRRDLESSHRPDGILTCFAFVLSGRRCFHPWHVPWWHGDLVIMHHH